jgi:hypothetical protein
VWRGLSQKLRRELRTSVKVKEHDDPLPPFDVREPFQIPFVDDQFSF